MNKPRQETPRQRQQRLKQEWSRYGIGGMNRFGKPSVSGAEFNAAMVAYYKAKEREAKP